jgi:hypothetical protein
VNVLAFGAFENVPCVPVAVFGGDSLELGVSAFLALKLDFGDAH